MKWKNRVIHAGVLVLVFLAAVVIFGYVTNKKNSNMTTDMRQQHVPRLRFLIMVIRSMTCPDIGMRWI